MPDRIEKALERIADALERIVPHVGGHCNEAHPEHQLVLCCKPWRHEHKKHMGFSTSETFFWDREENDSGE